MIDRAMLDAVVRKEIQTLAIACAIGRGCWQELEAQLLADPPPVFVRMVR